MTLIITVEAKKHIVITADGRCTEKSGGVQKTTSNELQKIFPHPNKGFAIAHHGQNIIEKRPFKDIAEEFLVDNATKIGKTSIKNIAGLFAQEYGQAITKTLDNIPGNHVFGFLFLGFSKITPKPKIHEVFWETGQKTVKFKKHTDLVLSGDPQDWLKKYLDETKEKTFRKNKILKGSVQNAAAYCDKLYKYAEDAEAKDGKDRFGGHKHQLEVNKNGCNWLVPPKQLSPTAAGQ